MIKVITNRWKRNSAAVEALVEVAGSSLIVGECKSCNRVVYWVCRSIQWRVPFAQRVCKCGDILVLDRGRTERILRSSE